MNRRIRVVRVAASSCVLFAMSVVLASCAPFKGIERGWTRLWAPSTDDVAAVQVAVVSIQRWSAYRDSVQPTFKLTPADALQQVIPTTQGLDERVLTALGLRARVALASTTEQDVVNMPPQDDWEKAPNVQRTRTRSQEDASKLQFDESPISGRKASDLTATPPPTLSSDPMTRYWAATALYEEVQILNRILKDAAIGPDVTPYLVRLQVSVLPRTRECPYDAYTTISFFLGDWIGTPDLTATRYEQEIGTPPEKAVSVLPLLVTDDIESLAHSRSSERMADLALALAGGVPALTAGGTLQGLYDKIQNTIGKDLNSLFTVARLSDNTIRVRFGARFDPATTYQLVPQTHGVTVLVLVPSDPTNTGKPADPTNRPRPSSTPGELQKVRVVANTELIDTANGVILKAKGKTDSYCTLEEVLDTWQLDVDLAGDAEKRHHLEQCLLYDLYRNDFHSFVSDIAVINKDPKTGLPKTGLPEAVFNDALRRLPRSSISTASFDVPDRPEPMLPPEKLKDVDLRAIASDDGKSTLTVTVRGGRDLDSDKLFATLAIDGTTIQGLPAANTRVVGGSDVVASFPSTSLMNAGAEKKVEPIAGGSGGNTSNPAVSRIHVHLFRKSDDPHDLNLAEDRDYQCVLTKEVSPKSDVSLVVRSKAIRASHDGKGSVCAIMNWKQAKEPPGINSIASAVPTIHLTVTGCDVVSVQLSVDSPQGTTPPTPAAVLPQAEDGWDVPAGSSVYFSFSNLVEGQDVTIQAKDKSADVQLTPAILRVSVDQPEKEETKS